MHFASLQSAFVFFSLANLYTDDTLTRQWVCVCVCVLFVCDFVMADVIVLLGQRDWDSKITTIFFVLVFIYSFLFWFYGILLYIYFRIRVNNTYTNVVYACSKGSWQAQKKSLWNICDVMWSDVLTHSFDK